MTEPSTRLGTPLATAADPQSVRDRLGLRWWREMLYVLGFYLVYSFIRNRFGSASVGIEHAFPRAFAAIRGQIPRLVALRDAIAERPRIAAYLESPRRLPFSEGGIFRRYPELDLLPASE